MTANTSSRRSFGALLLDYRQPVGLLLMVVTLVMFYFALHLPIATRFEDLFPADHPNVVLYRQLRGAYGGAQTLVLMIRVKDGDIFNPKTLLAIQQMNDEVNKLPGVNHNEVFSLASYRVLYARALPGTLASTPFMYPKVPDTPAQIAELRTLVQEHGTQLAGLVTPDLKGALVIAGFNDYALDYGTIFDAVQNLIHEHEDANTRVYATGAVMFAAWGYHYLPRLSAIFGASALLMILLTAVCLGGRVGWWAPVVTGLSAAFWGMGFMALMGYSFDPIMLVIPLIMTARDLGHGIQWQGAYYDEFARLDDPVAACVAAADSMLRPGLLAILASVAGIVFVATGDIPVLRQIGLGGAVWMGSSLVVVLLGQPILVSYLRAPARDRVPERSRLERLARLPLAGNGARTGLIALGLLVGAIGLLAYRYVGIGYQTPGTPIYRTDAKVNLDTAEVGKFVPSNFAWVVLETPEYPDPRSTMGTKTLRMTDDLGNYLIEKGDAVAVLDFANVAEKPMDQLLHNGSPKFLALPDTEQLSAALWGFFFGASAPDEPKAYFAHEPSARSASVRILLPDHTTARLNKLRADLDAFVRERVASDPELKGVTLRYVGGEAGLYQAIDDVTPGLNLRNLGLTLGAIFVAGSLVMWSPL